MTVDEEVRRSECECFVDVLMLRVSAPFSVANYR